MRSYPQRTACRRDPTLGQIVFAISSIPPAAVTPVISDLPTRPIYRKNPSTVSASLIFVHPLTLLRTPCHSLNATRRSRHFSRAPPLFVNSFISSLRISVIRCKSQASAAGLDLQLTAPCTPGRRPTTISSPNPGSSHTCRRPVFNGLDQNSPMQRHRIPLYLHVIIRAPVFPFKLQLMPTLAIPSQSARQNARRSL
ncbi:hypothetical protein SCP_0208570 [Sparassis crispa]|uniref:Uncharacterized protein n=1 Tax=Sparassis crispa TaxID=139825 RepID=A0A401GBX7_9APHY|nr:hypothetical protein SCP_0208570 [Sparassis crispa]GBE79657.1 hypothetical protein SCP_0208570 [Sparassis crispa]